MLDFYEICLTICERMEKSQEELMERIERWTKKTLAPLDDVEMAETLAPLVDAEVAAFEGARMELELEERYGPFSWQ